MLERERSVAILGNVADGIVAVDRDGNVVLWNAAAEEITGVPASEALGRAPTDVLQRSLDPDETSEEGRGLIQIPRGGEEVWLSVSEAVMRDPAGAVAGRIYAFRDVSADRLVEQLKSGFVSTVSHELRAPLTSIYGFAETLLREDVAFGDEERRTFLGYIASEAERLTAIVDALLSVARLEAGDLQVQLAQTDLRDVVTDVVSSAQREVVERPPVRRSTFRRSRSTPPPTARRSARSSPTSSTTPSSSRREGGTVTVAARRTRRRGPGAGRSTRARACPPASRSGSSGSSTGPTQPTRTRAGPVSGSSSRAGWRRRWAAGSGSTPTTGAGASFVFELPTGAAPSAADRGTKW